MKKLEFLKALFEFLKLLKEFLDMIQNWPWN